jgi:surface protein
MFGNCTSLKKANLSNWDLSNSQTSRLFKNCTSLEKVYLSEFPLVESEMFSNCTALDDIYMYADVAPGKDTSVDDPFTNIKTYGTLHIKEGATGYRDEP